MNYNHQLEPNRYYGYTTAKRMEFDINTIKQRAEKLDSQGMFQSIEMLSKQVKHAWEDASRIDIPQHYAAAKKIVLFGMGGSALGMDIIKVVFSDELTVPVLVENGYDIPAYVDQDTLAIVSSYSGNTEEVVTVAKNIADKTDKVFVVTTGGQLQELAEKNNWPTYIIDPQYNPCGQPRIAVGYAVTGLLAALTSSGFINVTDQKIDDIIHYLDGNRTLLDDEAARVLSEMVGKVPIFVGSEFLEGNIHVMSNQTNENGKNFACQFYIPELNHHLLEGFSNPKINADFLHVIFVESNLYHERNQKRFAISKQVLDKQNISYSSFIPTGSNKAQQSFEVLQWGSFLSFYISMYNEIDPSPIPWVDYFKDALK